MELFNRKIIDPIASCKAKSFKINHVNDKSIECKCKCHFEKDIRALCKAMNKCDRRSRALTSDILDPRRIVEQSGVILCLCRNIVPSDMNAIC